MAAGRGGVVSYSVGGGSDFATPSIYLHHERFLALRGLILQNVCSSIRRLATRNRSVTVETAERPKCRKYGIHS